MVEKLLTKAIQLGLGVADVTREQVEKFVKEVSKYKEMNTKQGRRMVDKLLKEAKASKKKLEAKIDAHIKKAIAKANIVTKKDLARLEKRIDSLKKKK